MTVLFFLGSTSLLAFPMRLVVANGGSQLGYVGGTPRSTLLVMEVTEGAASIRGLLPFLPFLYASFSSFFSFLLSFSLYEPPPTSNSSGEVLDWAMSGSTPKSGTMGWGIAREVLQ